MIELGNIEDGIDKLNDTLKEMVDVLKSIDNELFKIRTAIEEK